MINKTDGAVRRLGKYHHGEPTKVVGVRLPVRKVERMKEMAEAAGMTTSEWVEWILDTQPFRSR